jgi:hypothetical protein
LSRPLKAHPLFGAFIKAVKEAAKSQTTLKGIG